MINPAERNALVGIKPTVGLTSRAGYAVSDGKRLNYITFAVHPQLTEAVALFLNVPIKTLLEP